MTREAQRIAIAEACGWEHQTATHEKPVDHGGMRLPNHFSIVPIEAWWNDRDQDHTGLYSETPRYLTDLNAIHKAVMALPDDDKWSCFVELAKIVDPQIPAACASAAQWSEAYLRTTGRWVMPPNSLSA